MFRRNKSLNIVQNNNNRNKYIQMTLSERIEKAKVLKRGDITLIAEKSGVTVAVVYRFIKGSLNESAAAPYFEALVKKREEEIANISFD